MFTVRGLGSILGTVSSGWAFDRFEKLAYLMLSLIILMGVISELLCVCVCVCCVCVCVFLCV